MLGEKSVVFQNHLSNSYAHILNRHIQYGDALFDTDYRILPNTMNDTVPSQRMGEKEDVFVSFLSQ